MVLLLQHQFLDLAVEDIFTLRLDFLKPGLGVGLVLERRGGALGDRAKLTIEIHHYFSFLILLLIDHSYRPSLNFVGHAVSVDPFGEKLVPEFH